MGDSREAAEHPGDDELDNSGSVEHTEQASLHSLDKDTHLPACTCSRPRPGLEAHCTTVLLTN